MLPCLKKCICVATLSRPITLIVQLYVPLHRKPSTQIILHQSIKSFVDRYFYMYIKAKLAHHLSGDYYLQVNMDQITPLQARDRQQLTLHLHLSTL